MKNRHLFARMLVFILMLTCCISCNNFNEKNIITSEGFDTTPSVSTSVTSFNFDVFYSDPVLTKQNDILILGLINKCILEFESESIFDFKTPIGEGKMLTYSKPITPSWSLENDKLVQSVTFDPETKDIYVLYNNVDLLSSSFPNIISKSANMKEQEIGIVVDSKLTELIPIVSDNSFSKIKLYNHTRSGKTFLLATDIEGLLYAGTLTAHKLEFVPIISDIPEFISWDFANDILLGLDKESQVYINKLSLANNGNIEIERKPEIISFPSEKKMINPILQYNPTTNCIILWDGVLNGNCFYALYESDTWHWKQSDVSPMVVYPFSIVDISMYPYQNVTVLFHCYGIKGTESSPNFYTIYANP